MTFQIQGRLTSFVTGLYVMVVLLGCSSCATEESGEQSPVHCDPDDESVVETHWWVSWMEFELYKCAGFDLDGEWHDSWDDCGRYGIDNNMGRLVDAHSDIISREFPIEPALAIEDDDVVLLLITREGRGDGGKCYDVIWHNGVDLDGDPLDNASGSEQFEVASDSVLPGGTDALEHARYVFELEDEYKVSHSDYNFSADITAGPVPEAVLSWRLPDGEVFPVRLYRIHIHAKRESGHLSGILGAYVHIEDAAYLYWRLLPEDESVSLQTVVNTLVGSLDGDVVPEGATDVPCDEEGYDADCPFGASWCEDGYCYHVPEIPEGISMTLAFSAVWCEITGVARD